MRQLILLAGLRLFFSAALLSTSSLCIASPPSSIEVAQIVFAEQPDINALRALGPEILAVMADLYAASDENKRITLARTFYRLGWKSPEAEQMLMRDVHTDNPTLRLQVQWALGRVSDAPEVVEVLLENMQSDQNPLFRDKAACALAYDQIHLNRQQKFRLFEGVIGGLEDPKLDVRKISIQVLKIHTGQDKGFNPNAPEAERAAKVEEWKKWLEEYRASL
ncbi:MAG: HEAT repeat domain-containing protein [Gammaproteobacteria bacterium]